MGTLVKWRPCGGRVSRFERRGHDQAHHFSDRISIQPLVASEPLPPDLTYLRQPEYNTRRANASRKIRPSSCVHKIHGELILPAGAQNTYRLCRQNCGGAMKREAKCGSSITPRLGLTRGTSLDEASLIFVHTSYGVYTSQGVYNSSVWPAPSHSQGKRPGHLGEP